MYLFNKEIQEFKSESPSDPALMSKRPHKLLWCEIDKYFTKKVAKIKKQLTLTVTFVQHKWNHKTYAFKKRRRDATCSALHATAPPLLGGRTFSIAQNWWFQFEWIPFGRKKKREKHKHNFWIGSQWIPPYIPIFLPLKNIFQRFYFFSSTTSFSVNFRYGNNFSL